MTNIYVGNLPYSVGDVQLEEMFSPHGTVERAKVITDRETDRPRGFGFVEMPNDDEARAAMDALNGTEMDGRNLIVNEARPRR